MCDACSNRDGDSAGGEMIYDFGRWGCPIPLLIDFKSRLWNDPNFTSNFFFHFQWRRIQAEKRAKIWKRMKKKTWRRRVPRSWMPLHGPGFLDSSFLVRERNEQCNNKPARYDDVFLSLVRCFRFFFFLRNEIDLLNAAEWVYFYENYYSLSSKTNYSTYVLIFIGCYCCACFNDVGIIGYDIAGRIQCLFAITVNETIYINSN